MEAQPDYVVCDNILYVRECGFQSEAYSPNGEARGLVSSVTMRPATQEEVDYYQEQRELNAYSITIEKAGIAETSNR